MNNIRARARQVTLAAYSLIAVAVLAAVLALLPAAPAAAQTPGVTLTVSPTSLAEDAGATDIAVTATLSGVQSSATTVTLSLAGTANQGTDYSVAGTLPTITIPVGQTERSANVILTAADDTFWEGDETVVVNGSATGGLAVSGATLTLSDNETRPSIQLNYSPTVTLYEASPVETAFEVSANLLGQVTLETDTLVTLQLGGSARVGTHYSATVPSITISADTTSGSAQLLITPIDDAVPGDFNHITLTGEATDPFGSPFSVVSPSRFIRIVDNDPIPEILLAADWQVIRQSDLDAVPAGESFSITLTATTAGTLASPVTLGLRFSENQCKQSAFSAVPALEDLTLPADVADPSAEVTIELTPQADRLTRDCELLFLGSVTSQAGFTVRALKIPVISEATAAITRVGITNGSSVDPRNVVNAGEQIRFEVILNRYVRIVATAEESASSTLTFELGGTARVATCTGFGAKNSASCAYVVQPGDVDLDGPSIAQGAYRFTGKVVENYDLTRDVTIDTAIAEIYLGENGKQELYHAEFNGILMVHGARTSFELLASLESLQEGVGPTAIRVTATRVAGFPIGGSTSVPILFRNVTTSDDDYSIQGTLAIPVLAGEESGSATLTFTPTEDGLKEARTESLRIEGAVSEHYVLGTDFRIIDSPTIEIAVPSVSVAENGGAQTVTVTAELGDPSDSTRGRPIVVSLNLSGSAGPGDYTFAETLQVTIPAGARSGSASFTLTPEDDRLLEGDETIVVSGSTPALTVVGTGTITIEDDETAPEVILTANPDTIQEDDSVPTQITVSALLDPDIVLPDDATVVTLTLGGTATAGTGHDYTSAWNPLLAQITILQGEREGETTVTLTVTPLQDEVAEGEETIVVEGTASTGLVVDVRGSVITVVDDDIPGIVLEPKSIEITEGGTASYTVALALQPTETVTVTMTTALGATDLSVDITELYFTPENWNQPQTVNVDAMEDVDAVADATVTLVHEASGGAYEGVTSEATVTIKENDAPERDGLVNRPADPGGNERDVLGGAHLPADR